MKMFAEKHQDLGSVEQDLRKSLKHYRSLLRWGVDKVFADGGEVVEGLFNEIRQGLDDNNITQAGVLLDELNTKLREMEEKYPATKINLLVDVKDSINFIENVLIAKSDTSSSSFDEIKNESLKKLECARVSLQNDDWEYAKTIVDQVVDRYTGFRQDELLGASYPALEVEELVEVKQKLHTAFQSKLRHRTLSISELDKMFLTAESQNIATLRVAVFGSADSLSEVFSGLSKNMIDFKEIIEREASSAALLRIPVSRTMTAYIAGIPVKQRLNRSQIQEFAAQYSMMFIERRYLEDANLELYKLLLSCAEQLPAECIHIIGEAGGGSVLNQFDSINSVFLGELNTPNVVEGIYKSMGKAFVYR